MDLTNIAMAEVVARLTPTQLQRFRPALAAPLTNPEIDNLREVLAEVAGAPVTRKKAREYLEKLPALLDEAVGAGNGFDQYRQDAQKLIPATPELRVTPLQELAAKVASCAGAARLIEQGIVGGMDLIDLEGAADILADRLDSLVCELGALEADASEVDASHAAH